ncbi:MAG: ATP-grasp domain-containing protein [Bacteroidales bacterium]
MNILFTSAGRRGYLLSYFAEAMREESIIVAVDNNPLASALSYAHRSYISPKIFDSNYVDFLIMVAQHNNIELLIPLNDLEIDLLADSVDRFNAIGVKLLLPSKRVVEICMDKMEMSRVLSELGFQTPTTFCNLEDATNAILDGSLSFPIYLKARWGAGSQFVERIESIEELNLAYPLMRMQIERSLFSNLSRSQDPIIIQQAIDGVEYGVDVISNLYGEYQTCVIKKKLAMRSGETDKATIESHAKLEALSSKIASTIYGAVIIDCDIIEKDDKLYIIDINPRFGGGYPFSHAAGVNLPKALVNWMNGNSEYEIEIPQYGVTIIKEERVRKL